MAARKSTDAVLKKWTDRTAGAGEAVKAGVMAVTESPTAAAARAKDKWLANIQKSAADGTFEEGCAAVTKEAWQASMTGKGAANMATGVRDAATQSKQRKFLDQLLPYTAQVSEDIKGMANMTEADADARMLAAVNKMRQFKKRR